MPALKLDHTAKSAKISALLAIKSTSAYEILAMLSKPIAAIAGNVSMSSDSHRAVEALRGTAASQDRTNSARLSARRRAISTALATAARPAQRRACERSHVSGGVTAASTQSKASSTLKLSSTTPAGLTPARARRLRSTNFAAARRGALRQAPGSPAILGWPQPTLECMRHVARRTPQPPAPPRRFALAA